jgi:hypothetical protein
MPLEIPLADPLFVSFDCLMEEIQSRFTDKYSHWSVLTFKFFV